ncbi:flavin reductase family protein [Psittacicella hinzii]|uniref:Flavin reductase like domain-containing protein n=1 Tax=Psittacicella hinzii TaxID=2028575 RepID=A0A3A1YNK6_9GAMM|nr:flavin reductase family protein [Psittacicella hinzii]RIY38819.1 hypothetical protein CKF58_03315 [Psittacicella hinzii]
MTIKPVALDKMYRLLNHGPVTMLSAKHHDDVDVMSAAWVQMLDFDKVSMVVDSATYTRKLFTKSGYVVVQIPTAQQAALVLAVGSNTKNTNPAKVTQAGVEFVHIENADDHPFVAGAAAWLLVKLIDELEMAQKYDLFIGQVVGAWADDRVFRDGHWELESVSDSLRPIHYVAGGQFYLTGKSLFVKVPHAMGENTED